MAALSLALGALYVWLIRPGLPYDEPSHWSTVLQYANHGRLPVLGQPGVSYEAQQGPLAYTLDALLVVAARDLGASIGTCFRLVRLLGLAELAAAVPIVAAITRRLLGSSILTVGAIIVFALNPMVLTMSASVQNDSLALLLGLLTLQLALRWLSEQPAVSYAAVIGVVAGLGVLAKLTVLPAVIAVPVWLLWRHRRAALAASGAFVIAVVAVTGWWFVRNISLYGDPTGAAGVHRLGLSFPPYTIHGVSSVGHLAEEAVTYLWLPTEYLRNAFHAPAVLKAILVLITVAVILVGILRRNRLDRGAALIVICGVFALVYWLATSLIVQSVPPRLGYMAWPLWLTLVALAMPRRRPVLALLAVLALVAVLNTWALYHAAGFRSAIRFIPARLALTHTSCSRCNMGLHLTECEPRIILVAGLLRACVDTPTEPRILSTPA